MTDDALYFAAEALSHFRAAFVGRYKVNFNFIEPDLFEEKIDEPCKTLMYYSLALVLLADPIADLCFFRGLVPVMHANAPDYPIVVKNAERQRFLCVEMVQRLLYKLERLLGFGGLIYPFQPRLQMSARTVHRFEQFLCII